MPELLFINKSPSSNILTRSKAGERSRILSHVQNRRRRDEARKKLGARMARPSQPTPLSFAIASSKFWLPSRTQQPSSDDDDMAKSESGRNGRGPGVSDRNTTSLVLFYPTDNSSDPFYSTVAGRDAGSHAMLQLSFGEGVKVTFLAEAFAPTNMFPPSTSMRHDVVIQHRLQRCIEDDLLMYATLAYGSSCAAWMFGILDDERPPEYFIDKAVRQAQVRLASLQGDTKAGRMIDKQWFALSIYALAITEIWNHMPELWARCPQRQALAMRISNPSQNTSRTHLRALVHFVQEAGGWGVFDPYVLESSLLADKYLALWEMAPPIIPLTFDPGPPPETVGKALTRLHADNDGALNRLGQSFLNHPYLDADLRVILADVADYVRIARGAWAEPSVISSLQSWLFLRLQALFYRLLLLDNLPPVDEVVRLTALTFLLATTQYHGARLSAESQPWRIRAAMLSARYWDNDEFTDGLRFWCLVTAAMSAREPNKEWFLSRIVELVDEDNGLRFNDGEETVAKENPCFPGSGFKALSLGNANRSDRARCARARQRSLEELAGCSRALFFPAVDLLLLIGSGEGYRPFGGIPMVLFFGDFFQFDPVLQTSLLLPAPRDRGGQRPESLAKHLAAHRLFLQFTTVVILQEQCKASFVDGLRAITPLNQYRWDLNRAAVVQWARAYGKHISIFVAKHDTESAKRLRVEELGDVLRHGDNSQLPTPGLFFYAQGMPVVVTRNQFVGLKAVNGAPFKAVDIFPDLAAGTIALASDVTLHLGPPVAVLLQTGPLCTPAFAMTDQKSQGKQFSNVLVNLKGVHSSGTATRPSFMSLYVQLSRAQSWDGLHLFRKPARSDFIEPKNVLDKDMRDAILKLERQGEETRRRFEQDHRHEPWFQEWAAMPESGQGTETDDVEDAALWRDPGVSELRS
ncbi:predicted protein [Chaetomium globosum CBS 148.51]|uniref:Uncharacterized protein n=1 Tax=Chaetomium globosum (strain ATCC 6205 / CBS 148.51 / DSM 1962 / NBRC 6347 / NRRL 1970) TaxID=306901 RepID=Q2H3M6_CHAGB|nr:uncharacterized protein CHGG_06739 [Chaetomium globosum CBS 148.51]EAQ90120.1 predicted protein [Chaetomium globosum CBS 148.51]